MHSSASPPSPTCLWFGSASLPPRALRDALAELGCDCVAVGELAGAQRRLENGEFGALLVDVAHPEARDLLHAVPAHGVARLATGDLADPSTLPADVEWLDGARSTTEAVRAIARALRCATQERTLAATEARLERAHRFARIGAFEIDWNAQRICCSPQAQCLFGLEGAPAEMPLVEFARRVAGDATEPWYCWWSTLAAGAPQGAFEQRLQLADGSERIVRLHGERMATPGAGLVVHAVVHDVTDRRRVESTLAFQANHDELTGLANRRQVKEALARALRGDSGDGHLAVFVLDLDRLKDVNESLGHAAGDQLLIAMAERLRSSMRTGASAKRRGHAPDLIARIGGDQFAAVVSGLGRQDDAESIAARMRAAIVAPLPLAEREIVLTSCIGYAIAATPTPGAPPTAGAVDPDVVAEELITQAETALHAAKKLGRASLRRFDPAMFRDAQDRLQLEAALRRALDRGEFEVWYQPRVELRSGRITGFEALVRWRMPDGGMAAPQQFITLAEESGLIVPLGTWVLREACRQAQEWRQAGFVDLTMAVNVSAVQFRAGDLQERVADALAATGLPADALELEVTESTLMADVESALATLRQLKASGIHIAIDDFGTGYSSLAYLKRLPLDCLKIDKSFVNDVTTDADDAAIAVLIITMAHRLRLYVVAEGAETEEQVEFLRREGCEQVQGYFFGKPQPAAETTALLDRQLVQPAG